MYLAPFFYANDYDDVSNRVGTYIIRTSNHDAWPTNSRPNERTDERSETNRGSSKVKDYGPKIGAPWCIAYDDDVEWSAGVCLYTKKRQRSPERGELFNDSFPMATCAVH